VVIGSKAQVSKSAYFMDHLPIANSLNPAFTPPNTFYINIPIISSIYVSVGSPINYSQLTQKNIEDDKIYIDKLGIINSMDEVETLSFDFCTELGRVGFRKGKHSFNFNIAKTLSTDVSLERELVKFLLFGNGSEDFLDRNILLSKTGIKATLYHEFGLGYAYEVNDKLTVGIKLKYLNGAVNVWSEKANVNIETDAESNYDISASTDILVHTASSYGYLDELTFSDPMDYLWFDISNNHGFGGDLGARYKPLKDLSLSASVVDLGMIHWKENVESYKSKYPNKTYTFTGFDISNIVNGGSISDSIMIGDSLSEHFTIETVNDPYTSYLTPKAYFGVTYDVSKHDQFGFLIKGKFPENNFLTSYTINYRRTFGDILALYVNYTFQQRSNHLGLGFSVRGGPVMIYLLNDMANAFYSPTKAKAYNVQFGISFVFGKPYRTKLPEPENEILPIKENSDQGPIEKKKDEYKGESSLNFTLINSL
jgi:hypothetical protein